MAESHGGAKGPSEGTHTEAEGGHGGGFPPFESSTYASQLVALAIFFVVLYVIVSKLALPKVGGAIEARQNKIEGDLAEAQTVRDQADAALKAYEGELASARSRAQAIGNESRDKANAQAEAERKALEEQLAVKLAEAEKTIASTRTTAMSNVRGIAADAAGQIVRQLTGVVPGAGLVNAGVDASLKG